ncbi:MAG TPA: undecaprenyl-diphosphatase UppP [Thermoanaerobaculia bacterium]|nr:undecaprenyl-diphosphatase UppP [Thermoanaerobaculia bacterium]
MSILEAIVLGLVQGLTEFIPISSTGHLKIVPELLGWGDPGAAVSAVIQFGTILAVIIYFFRDIVRLTVGFFRGLATRKPFGDPDSREAWYVIFATIPIVVLGVLLKDLIEGVFRSTWVVTFQLIFIAILMQIAEAYAKRRGVRPREDFNARDAWWMGFGQCIALIPGSSRSGSTIMTALFRRVTHDYAARFSFVMSIPAITAAGVFQLVDSKDELASIGATPILVAIVVAFISGWLSIYFLLRYLRTHTTHVFIYYRYILGAILAGLLLTSCTAMPSRTDTRYLALGDSYTIGESVPAGERFPVQLAEKLGIPEPQIIAKTGWTTDELDAAIDDANPQGPFDLVTLLIGVNNQYRGRSADEYRTQFTGLLNRAIGFAGGDAKKVVVVSIPDWGVTPFAEGRDRAKIAREIDQFNAVNREEAARVGAKWVDITPISRGADPALVAGDGLHPSGKQYGEWVKRIAR